MKIRERYRLEVGHFHGLLCGALLFRATDPGQDPSPMFREAGERAMELLLRLNSESVQSDFEGVREVVEMGISAFLRAGDVSGARELLLRFSSFDDRRLLEVREEQEKLIEEEEVILGRKPKKPLDEIAFEVVGSENDDIELRSPCGCIFRITGRALRRVLPTTQEFNIWKRSTSKDLGGFLVVKNGGTSFEER